MVVTVLGTGTMGAPMVRNLVGAGVDAWLAGLVETLAETSASPSLRLAADRRLAPEEAWQSACAMPHLTCPTCRLTITDTAAGSPFQACPRCLLKDRTHRTMELVREPTRFSRQRDDLARVTRERARLRPPARADRSA